MTLEGTAMELRGIPATEADPLEKEDMQSVGVSRMFGTPVEDVQGMEEAVSAYAASAAAKLRKAGMVASVANVYVQECARPGKTVLPSGNLLVVSVDRNKTAPHFIKAGLDCAYGQGYLAGGARGTSVVTFGPRILEEFPVPALPLARQREIGKVCRSKAKRPAELRDQLAAAKAELAGGWRIRPRTVLPKRLDSHRHQHRNG